MFSLKIKNTPFLKGKIRIPGDKSISHRAVIMGSLACGRSIIKGILLSEDVKSTINILRRLGVKIMLKNDPAIIQGVGLYGLKRPSGLLDAGNSGTTARLMMGVLAGQDFTSTITGDNSLRRRPMARVTDPLRMMGVEIKGTAGLDKLPLTIKGGHIRGITYTLPIPSAQVKSALLLAGLFSHSPTTIIEPIPSRDHTEIMFKYLGLPILRRGKTIRIEGGRLFQARDMLIPGDISSAAFFLVAGLLLKGSRITLQNVGLNPLRLGLIKTLQRMAAKFKIIPYKSRDYVETCGDIIMEAQPPLRPFHLKARDIPGLIDEIPVLSVLATQIKGTSTIRGARELRVKETDRLKAIALNIRRLGGEIKELPDGLVITGGTTLRGAVVESFGDHRMAMSMAIAGLIAEGETVVKDSSCINISFPEFVPFLKKLGGRVIEELA